MSDIGDWFRSIPTITRYWFAATVAVPLVGKLGLISPAYFFLWPEAFLYRFQLLMIPLIMSVLYVWAQLNRDMIVSFWFGTRFKLPWVSVVSPASFADLTRSGPQAPQACVLSELMDACYLPWVILGFNYIIGGSVINELIGNLVGHLYFFLMFRYPMDLGGRNFLSTPQFLYRWLPSRRGGVSGFGVPPASMRRAADQNGGGGRHNWGQGFRLGDQ
ncbi:DERL1 [Cervus elaphus hippelaphus]|uniref:Derlin n=1 Tax=Cervus elaphus hippelaphus TaxID=46360 RepID=A0A212CEB3_CEREH|nr:DERL1 [Cervus elaphus hippelaphus]